MKKRSQPKTPTLTAEEKDQDYAERLSELASDVHAQAHHRGDVPRAAHASVTQVKTGQIGPEDVIEFIHQGQSFAIGFMDRPFPGTNGARGSRRIQLFNAARKVVMSITGEFQNQQFGANFRLPKLQGCEHGEWEKSFLELTDNLRSFREQRKERHRKLRAKNSKS